MITKESEITIAVLNYVGRCIAENDLPALRDVQLPYDVATRLNRLSMMDVHRYASSRVVPCKVVFDADLLDRTLDHMEDERIQEAVIARLVAADAPLAMLEHLSFVMTKWEYRRRRAEAGVIGGVGRTPEPDTCTSLKVWEAMKDVLAGRDVSEATIDDYLIAHTKTALSLRTIWKVIAIVNRGDIC